MNGNGGSEADTAGRDAVVYGIDENDEIAFVNPAWDRFAERNNASWLTGRHVLHRPLWDFVTDLSTRELYRKIVAQARSGRTLSFPFRCDAPDRRRFMEMKVYRDVTGAVRFDSHTARVEPREALQFPPPSESAGPVRQCAWCKRIDVGSDRWVEIEEAIRRLDIFGNGVAPALTHGICGDCLREMRQTLDR